MGSLAKQAILGKSKESLLGNPHESGGNGHAEDGNAPELMMWQVHAAQTITQLGEQERDEAAHPLHAEEDDGDEAEPRVHAVHVGDGLRQGVVVRVEDGLERHRGKHEHGHLDETVQDLNVQLNRVAHQAVHKHG